MKFSPDEQAFLDHVYETLEEAEREQAKRHLVEHRKKVRRRKDE